MLPQIAEQPTLKIAATSPRYSLMRLIRMNECSAKKAYLSGEILHLFAIPNVHDFRETPAPRSFMECEPLAACWNTTTYSAALESFKKRNECVKIGFYRLEITQEDNDGE